MYYSDLDLLILIGVRRGSSERDSNGSNTFSSTKLSCSTFSLRPRLLSMLTIHRTRASASISRKVRLFFCLITSLRSVMHFSRQCLQMLELDIVASLDKLHRVGIGGKIRESLFRIKRMDALTTSSQYNLRLSRPRAVKTWANWCIRRSS